MHADGIDVQMVSRGPDQGDQRLDQQIPQARFAHGAVRVPSTALDHGKVRHQASTASLRPAKSHTGSLTCHVVDIARDCVTQMLLLLQHQEQLCRCKHPHVMLMQDMVVFGGVNPLQDLNDVAIWQGV